MKTTIVAATLCIVSLYSCKKSGDNPSTDGNTPSLVGTWIFVDEVNWHTQNGQAPSPQAPFIKDTIRAYNGEKVVFKADGTSLETWWDDVNNKFYTSHEPYVLQGNTLVSSWFPNNSVITISGNTLTIANADITRYGENLWWHYKK